ncbi:hypothetical protein CKAH01_10033 [Colletotrichum kahawae]|uniref:Fungal N-terminal domain-containing protein n=1 Tax=Colletotrichum kahawae TaxID=34407 RepID=A0AAD9Y0C5_COLKA|nr:hypothetical protein CKAH01_10033 [Colletotrichum kahawae]
MEVVGAVASVVTLAELAIKATRQARKLHKRLRNAPLDLEDLRENVGIIETITEQLAVLPGDGVEAPGLREALATTETELRALNEEIDRHIPVANDAGKLRTRVRWAWFTPSAIKENNRRLSATLDKLQILMTFYIL